MKERTDRRIRQRTPPRTKS